MQTPIEYSLLNLWGDTNVWVKNGVEDFIGPTS